MLKPSWTALAGTVVVLAGAGPAQVKRAIGLQTRFCARRLKAFLSCSVSLVLLSKTDGAVAREPRALLWRIAVAVAGALELCGRLRVVGIRMQCQGPLRSLNAGRGHILPCNMDKLWTRASGPTRSYGCGAAQHWC